MIIYAEKGNIKKAITDDNLRPINKENLHPMSHWMIDNGFLEDCVQIRVPFLAKGDSIEKEKEVWINVRKSELHHVGRKSMAGWLLYGKSFTDYVQPGERVTADIIDHFQGTVTPEHSGVEGPFFMVGEPMGDSALGRTYMTFAMDPGWACGNGGGTFLGVFSKAAFKLEVFNHPEWRLNKWE